MLSKLINNNWNLYSTFKGSQSYFYINSWLQLNRWFIFILLILIASTGVIFVNNVNAISGLMSKIKKLETIEAKVLNYNKTLYSEHIKLQESSRIIGIARTKLYMFETDEVPIFVRKVER